MKTACLLLACSDQIDCSGGIERRIGVSTGYYAFKEPMEVSMNLKKSEALSVASAHAGC